VKKLDQTKYLYEEGAADQSEYDIAFVWNAIFIGYPISSRRDVIDMNLPS
jgi:hypothetical protein